jgi:hypothetical protein
MSTQAPAAPGPLPDGPPQPAADPGAARTHVRRLRQDGSTYAGIATAAGLAPATVSGLAVGRRRPTRGTTAAVLGVTSGAVPRGRVDAGGTRLRLRALHVMGHGSARIARALGVRETAISELVRGDARTIRPRLRVLPGAEDSDVGGVHDADEEPGNSGGLMVVVPGLMGEVPG